MKFPNLKLWLRHNNKDYDITPMVDGITWSGDYKQAARTLDFDLLYPTNDINVSNKTIVPEVGDYITFNVDGKEVFRGIVWTVDVTENNQFIQVNCYDIAVYLTKSSLAYNLKGIAPEATAKKVCDDLKLPIGTFEAGGVTYNDCALGKTGYDMIMAGYTEAMKKNNNKYMIRAELGKINVIKKGVVKVPIELDSKVNVFNAQFNETLDGMVNKVIVYDETGAIKHTEENTQWQNAYGILQSAISYQEDEDNVALAKKALKDTTKKCSVEGFGDVRAITGNAITLKVPHTKLTGLFYIDNDTHNWKNETYTMSLTIAFENLMDEVDIQKESEDKSSSGGSGSSADINGKEVKAQFTAYYPANDTMQGGFYDAMGNKLDPSKLTCAAPKEIPFGTKIKVLGTGTDRDGLVYTVTDRGGAIKIVDGVYKFDLLMANKTQAYNFGRRNGKAIIGDGSSSSNSSNGVTSKGFKWPAPGIARITSRFGPRVSPGGIGSNNHKGIDIGTPVGSKIIAARAGTVIHADNGYNGGYGKLIKIKHDDGYETRYAHLSSISVKKGQKVSIGQEIAKSGNTGNSTGPHLHFEIRLNGVPKNPANYV